MKNEDDDEGAYNSLEDGEEGGHNYSTSQKKKQLRHDGHFILNDDGEDSAEEIIKKNLSGSKSKFFHI